MSKLDWLKDHAFEALSFAGLSLGGITALVKDALSMAKTNPEAFFFWTIACMAFGALVGTTLSGRSKAAAEAQASVEIAKSKDLKELELQRMAYEREDAKKAKADEEARQKAAEAAIDRFMNADYYDKLLAARIYIYGPIVLDEYYQEPVYDWKMFATETVGRNVLRADLVPELRSVIDKKPSLLEFADSGETLLLDWLNQQMDEIAEEY